ncbi:MAG: transcription-repair coupling factor, partial [Cytophagales bacterium]
MSISEITSKYKDDLKVLEVSSRINNNKHGVFFSGLSGNLDVILPLSVSQKDKSSHCFILSDKEKALVFYSNLCNFLNKNKVYFFPFSFLSPYDEDLLNNANVVMRTEAIQAVVSRKKEKIYIVTYPEGLFEKFPSEKFQNKLSLSIERTQKLNIKSFRNTLLDRGFSLEDFIAQPGDLAIRGNIIDVFSFSYKNPIRIEMDGDFVEKIKVFDVESQLTKKEVESVVVVSNLQSNEESKEYLSLFGFFDSNWCVWSDGVSLSANIINENYLKSIGLFKKSQKKSNVLLKLPPEKIFLDKDSFLNEIHSFKVIETQNKTIKTSKKIHFNSTPQPSFNKNLSLLADDLKDLEEKGYTLNISFQSEEQILRLTSYFESIGLTTKIKMLTTKLSEGFVDHENKVVFYTDHQIFNRYYKHSFQPKVVKKQKNPINDRSELNTGDYVVHIDHGVGRFVGLEKIKSKEIEYEVLRVVYKNNDVVYINVNSLHKIARYSGADSTPKLNNLSSNDWDKKKKKIKSRLVDIAEDLINLYLKRREVVGFSFQKDSYLQIELESSFVYQDTPDQLKTTEDVKKDMEGSFPMDRLVCGDVGFGKTEIAVRAAFKAVCSNKQVLILVPTTILAFQHFKTFKKRLQNFPVSVDYLSRFRTSKDKKRIVDELVSGSIDILIGTHSVLSNKVKFKDLGLLIVDEEQKFGVTLKEKIKKRKLNLDCLTLTATPIPRTLHFSLIGVRDISIIRTAPPNRQPVHTEVIQFNENEIRDTITNEMSRFGQTFFVHNRVENIYEIANIIQKLVPNAKVAVAHGQQKGDMLEKTVLNFIDGRFDVLVSTNIIESGLDIPNANTIIINQAHMFGLSDLHQMRGRVGRSNRKAFCRLLVPRLSNLNPDAKKRLIALEEFSNLGDGLNIALKDLDIRGAGNLLGGEQSGFINDLGFDTYNKILDEALKEVDKPMDFKQNKLNKVINNHSCLVDVYEKAFIPKDYISNSNERLRVYGFLEEKSKLGLYKEILSNLKDRFGALPDQVLKLIGVMKIKKIGSYFGLDKIIIKKNKVKFLYFNNSNKSSLEQESFLSILNYLNKFGFKTSVVEKKDQLIINALGPSSINKTLD